ncbi:MAG: hypothetical protein ABIP65_01790 [Vicinamibacterales bacterium]
MRARILRTGATVCSVFALLALSMLPAEHLHRTEAAPALIHRHVVDQAVDQSSAAAEHADHPDATTLEPVFMSVRQFVVGKPIAGAATLVILPDRRFVGRVDPTDIPRLHGPPIRFDSLPAPPA